MKIIFLDIETTPILGYTYGIYDTTVIKVKEDWKIISFSYKVMGEEKVYAFTSNDEQDLINRLHKVLDKADIIVAHNGDNFDIKKINARLIFYGHMPPSPYKTIDTLKICRRHFKFTSNRLDYVCTQLGLGSKLKHEGAELWDKAMSGNRKALSTMKEYNKQDVVLLEKLYIKLRPFIQNHPALQPKTDYPSCPNCKSDNLRRAGSEITKTKVKQKYQCLDCGSWTSK